MLFVLLTFTILFLVVCFEFKKEDFQQILKYFLQLNVFCGYILMIKIHASALSIESEFANLISKKDTFRDLHLFEDWGDWTCLHMLIGLSCFICELPPDRHSDFSKGLCIFSHV